MHQEALTKLFTEIWKGGKIKCQFLCLTGQYVWCKNGLFRFIYTPHCSRLGSIYLNCGYYLQTYKPHRNRFQYYKNTNVIIEWGQQMSIYDNCCVALLAVSTYLLYVALMWAIGNSSKVFPPHLSGLSWPGSGGKWLRGEKHQCYHTAVSCASI